VKSSNNEKEKLLFFELPVLSEQSKLPELFILQKLSVLPELSIVLGACCPHNENLVHTLAQEKSL
jgi:hypothetical protein